MSSVARYGMLIDTRRCVECFACRVACERQNGLDASTPLIRYEELEIGSYPAVTTETIPVACMHCDDAPCAAVCPTGATTIGDDGIVRIDQTLCIGCKQCSFACPYGARVFNQATHTMDKCRLCAAEVADGEPTCNCVAACMTGARMVGDLDNPESAISKAIEELGAKPLVEGVTASKVFYVR